MEHASRRGVGFEIYATPPRRIQAAVVAPTSTFRKKVSKRQFAKPFWLVALGILCVSVIAWPYVPALKIPLQNNNVLHHLLPVTLQAPSASIPTSGNWLIIPSINVKEQIWDGQSLAVLNSHEGVWHQTGEIAHNFVLAGHRFQYLPPNTNTFYNLNKLKTGDTITLVWNGSSRTYSVTTSNVVAPNDLAILDQDQASQLTLYTCSDWATSHRLVVVAKALL